MDLDLNLLAPINNLGYGVAAQNILYGLQRAGVEVALFPIGQVQKDGVYPGKEDSVRRALNVAQSRYQRHAPSLRIYHQNALAEHVGIGPHIGFPIFELNKFTPIEKHHLENQDKVFVASEWAKGVVEDQLGSMPTHVIPLGVDREIFSEQARLSPRINSDTTVFVNIGKWEVRKGHDVLVNAFNKAFDVRDRVELVMMCYNPFIGAMNDQWASLYLNSPLGQVGKIRLLPRSDSVQGVAQVLANADCGVWAARAEGWNLEPLEMMSTGGYVITTDYSGHTEYINKENSRLINVTSLEDAHDGVWFHGQGQWGKIGQEQEDQLIHHLREVHRLKQSGSLGMNTNGIETAKKFSWDETAQAILKGCHNVD